MPRRLAACCIAAVALAGVVPGAAHAQDGPSQAGGPLVVVAAPDADAWVRLLRAGGGAVRPGTLDEVLARPAGVVTAAGLDADQRARVRRWVVGGHRLVTPDPNLLTALGVGRGPATDIASVRMDGVSGDALWPAPRMVQPLLGRVRAVATARDAVVAGVADVGKGQVLALAVDPFGDGLEGHELLPALGRVADSFARAPDGPQRTGAEVYLDPGSLHNGVSAKPAELARRLAGARIVHVAGWNADNGDPRFDYDYRALIDALHARGILAYAWVEPPFVSLRFWLDHPECREKTATGRDALVDWRRLIALEDPHCFDLAAPVFRKIATAYPFDGVDVAELYFEPDRMRDDYTPFHPSALAQFGGDPNADATAFRAFRTRLVTDLNDKMLRLFNGVANARNLGFTLTVIDNKADPAFGQQIGSDIDALAGVAARNGASLQVEDPFTQWALGPLRYDTLVSHLAGLTPPVPAYVDVNVVDREAGRPTPAMTGAELDLAVSSASQGAGRLALYSAGTIGEGDMAHVPAAMAGTAAIFDTGVRSLWTVTARAPNGKDRRLTVDGVPWPAGPGLAVIPRGEHRLVWSTGTAIGPALLRFTGELGAAAVSTTSLRLSYDSRGAAYAVVDRRPTNRPSVADPAGGFAVRLPGAGTNTVTLAFHSGGRSLLPFIAVGLAVLVAAAGALLLVRRR